MDKSPGNTVQIWFQAIRFPSLTAGLIPVMLGGAYAVMDRAFQSVPFLLALLASMLIQAGTHLFNDYFDHKSGADVSDSLLPSSVIQQGLLTPRQVYRGAVVCFALSLILGICLAKLAGVQILWFGLLGLVLGYCFTGGPFPFSYRALGEVAVFFAMGPLMVLAAYYAQVGMLRWTVFLGSLPVGFLAAAILHTNNLRDRDHDPSVGKITLANLLSDKGAKLELTLLVISSYIVQVILTLSHVLPWLSLVSFLSLPLAVTIIKRTWTSTTLLEMNLVLGLTVLLQLLYGIAYTLGLFSSTLLT